MDGLWTAVFALVGVVIGGLFAYIGIKTQLKQQKEMSTLEWRRKVRSEPLFKLREELSILATKYQLFNDFMEAFLSECVNNKDFQLSKRMLIESNDLAIDIKKYLTEGTFQKIYFMLDEEEIPNKVHELTNKYKDMLSVFILQFTQIMNSITQTGFPPSQLEKPLNSLKGIRNQVREIQVLINKRLEAM
jgi:hypothetical protein